MSPMELISVHVAPLDSAFSYQLSIRRRRVSYMPHAVSYAVPYVVLHAIVDSLTYIAVLRVLLFLLPLGYSLNAVALRFDHYRIAAHNHAAVDAGVDARAEFALLRHGEQIARAHPVAAS